MESVNEIPVKSLAKHWQRGEGDDINRGCRVSDQSSYDRETILEKGIRHDQELNCKYQPNYQSRGKRIKASLRTERRINVKSESGLYFIFSAEYSDKEQRAVKQGDGLLICKSRKNLLFPEKIQKSKYSYCHNQGKQVINILQDDIPQSIILKSILENARK